MGVTLGDWIMIMLLADSYHVDVIGADVVKVIVVGVEQGNKKGRTS